MRSTSRTPHRMRPATCTTRMLCSKPPSCLPQDKMHFGLGLQQRASMATGTTRPCRWVFRYQKRQLLHAWCRCTNMWACSCACAAVQAERSTRKRIVPSTIPHRTCARARQFLLYRMLDLNSFCMVHRIVNLPSRAAERTCQSLSVSLSLSLSLSVSLCLSVSLSLSRSPSIYLSGGTDLNTGPPGVDILHLPADQLVGLRQEQQGLGIRDNTNKPTRYHDKDSSRSSVCKRAPRTAL